MTKFKNKNKKGGQDLIQNQRNKISNILQVSDNQNITKLFNILYKLKYTDQIKEKKTIINDIKTTIQKLTIDNTSNAKIDLSDLDLDLDFDIYNINTINNITDFQTLNQFITTLKNNIYFLQNLKFDNSKSVNIINIYFNKTYLETKFNDNDDDINIEDILSDTIKQKFTTEFLTDLNDLKSKLETLLETLKKKSDTDTTNLDNIQNKIFDKINSIFNEQSLLLKINNIQKKPNITFDSKISQIIDHIILHYNNSEKIQGGVANNENENESEQIIIKMKKITENYEINQNFFNLLKQILNKILINLHGISISLSDTNKKKYINKINKIISNIKDELEGLKKFFNNDVHKLPDLILILNLVYNLNTNNIDLLKKKINKILEQIEYLTDDSNNKLSEIIDLYDIYDNNTNTQQNLHNLEIKIDEYKNTNNNATLLPFKIETKTTKQQVPLTNDQIRSLYNGQFANAKKLEDYNYLSKIIYANNIFNEKDTQEGTMKEQICYVDPANGEVEKGNKIMDGPVGGLSKKIYEKIKFIDEDEEDKDLLSIFNKKLKDIGGTDDEFNKQYATVLAKITNKFNITKKYNEIISYNIKKSDKKVGILSIAGPNGNYIKEKKEFKNKLYNVYIKIFNSFEEKENEFKEFRIPLISSDIFSGEHDVILFTANILYKLFIDLFKKNKKNMLEKIKIYCADAEKKDRIIKLINALYELSHPAQAQTPAQAQAPAPTPALQESDTNLLVPTAAAALRSVSEAQKDLKSVTINLEELEKNIKKKEEKLVDVNWLENYPKAKVAMIENRKKELGLLKENAAKAKLLKKKKEEKLKEIYKYRENLKKKLKEVPNTPAAQPAPPAAPPAAPPPAAEVEAPAAPAAQKKKTFDLVKELANEGLENIFNVAAAEVEAPAAEVETAAEAAAAAAANTPPGDFELYTVAEGGGLDQNKFEDLNKLNYEILEDNETEIEDEIKNLKNNKFNDFEQKNKENLQQGYKEPIDDKYKAFLNDVGYNEDINNISINKLREYIYKIQNNEFYSDSKINNQDIILFIIITYVIRFITLYLILWLIDIDIIKSIETGLGFYIFIYLIIFLIIFSIVNISKTPTSLKSTFYYFYNESNNNNSRFFVHIGIIFMIGLIPFIISIKDFENKYSDIYLGQDEKRKLYKVINLISALSWLLLSILAFYL